MNIIDLSEFNPPPDQIDWPEVKGAGIDGVMVKMGEGYRTPSGALFVNPHFGDTYNAAKFHGLITGSYFVWHPEESWVDQVQWFWHHYTPVKGDLPPAWDSEINPTNRSWSDIVKELQAILQANASHYGDAWGYWNRDWNKNLDASGYRGGHGVWLAQGSPGPLMRAIAMQYAPVEIPGIIGLVDWSTTSWSPS